MRVLGINLIVLLLMACGCYGATFPNSFTTNSTGKFPSLLPTQNGTNLYFVVYVPLSDGTILQSPSGFEIFPTGTVSSNSYDGPVLQVVGGTPNTHAIGSFRGDLISVTSQDSDRPSIANMGVDYDAPWLELAMQGVGIPQNQFEVTVLDGMMNLGFQPYYFNTGTNVIAADDVLASFGNAGTVEVVVSGSGGVTANAWFIPTNGVHTASSVDFHFSEMTTNVSGAVSFTSLLNFSTTNYNTAVRHIVNTSGSDRTITVATGWRTDGGRTTATTYTATNNTVLSLLFECQIGQFTNVSSRYNF